MTIWLIILGMSLVTYGVRVLPLTVLREELLPPLVRSSLNYVPIAVLSAIISPEYLPSEDWFHYTIGAPLVAGCAAIMVAWFTKNVFATIAVGIALLVVLG
jgi:branched-subunit amino acid transport protein